MEKRRNHHYVPRFYLKQWLNNGALWCVHDDKLFSTGVSRVGAEIDFYRVEDLSDQEITLIKKSAIDDAPEVLRPYLEFVLEMFQKPIKLKRAVEQKDLDPRYSPAIEVMHSNVGESYHEIVERSFQPLLAAMLSGRKDFYSDPEQCAQFLGGLCLQYVRTKQARESAAALIGEKYKACNIRNVMNVVSYLISFRIALSLYREKENFNLRLLDNPTATPFITGDQPVINIHATFDGKPPDRMELFYPISPTRAMLLLDLKSKEPPEVSEITANNYNMLMVTNSHEQVYSNSREYLESILGPIKEFRRARTNFASK